MNRDRDPSGHRRFPPGVALMPEEFPRRLAALKELTGLTWEGMADALGVDPRQLLRWRNEDGEPNARRHAVPGAAGAAGAGRTGPARGRRRGGNLQTEEVTA